MSGCRQSLWLCGSRMWPRDNPACPPSLGMCILHLPPATGWCSPASLRTFTCTMPGYAPREGKVFPALTPSLLPPGPPCPLLAVDWSLSTRTREPLVALYFCPGLSFFNTRLGDWH